MPKRLAISSAVVALILLAIACISRCPVQAAASECVVVTRIDGCDYFMVQSATDYAVLEWYGGHDPGKDDRLAGEFNRYGMKVLRDETANNTLKVWVEEYGLTKSDALKKLTEKCQ